MSASACARDQADDALRALYERFPYPRAIDTLADFREGRRQPNWNPRTSFPVYFPRARPRDDLDVLVAGCGTNLAPIFAATMPRARVVGIDISGSSLELSRALAEREGLTNVEHHQLALEDVAELSRGFDFIACTGVLHHLADPVAGLSALGSVLRDDGAMQIMVYARYGRHGIYMLQELCDLLGLRIDEVDAARAQQLLANLPDDHPFRRVYPRGGPPISLEEVMDMVLNPRDVSYRVADVRALVEGAGLGFHRWLGNAEYRPESTSLIAAGLGPRAEQLDPWTRAAAAELTFGTLIKHNFVVTHPQRPSADAVFSGDAILDAIPSLAAHIRIEHHGAMLTAKNDAHQVDVGITAPVAEMASALKACDNKRTVRQLVAQGAVGDAEAYRALYHADAVQLSCPGQ